MINKQEKKIAEVREKITLPYCMTKIEHVLLIS
jgi:hypothetical protein